MLDFTETDVIYHVQTVYHVSRYAQYVKMDITEIHVTNNVILAVKHVIYLLDHVLNVRMDFMEVSVCHVVLDVKLQHVVYLMVIVNVNLVTTR